MKSFGIRARILLAALAPATLVAVLVSGMLVVEHMQQAHVEQHHRLSAVARQLAVAAEYNLFVGNDEALAQLLGAATREPDVIGAAFIAPDGRVMASTVPVHALPDPTDVVPNFEPAAFSEHLHHWHGLPIRATQQGEADLFADAGEMPGPLLGQLLLKISNESLNTKMRSHTYRAATTTGLMLIFGVLLALALSRGLIRVLGEIGRVIDGIRRGRHDLRVNSIDTHQLGELGALAQGINTMAESVGQTQETLARHIDAATTTLRRERDEAAQAVLARSRFFTAASHDLRQPVQALGLFAARLERDARRSTLRPRVAQLVQSVNNLQGLLDTLLDYSRLDGQVYRLEQQPIYAPSLINAIATEFSASAAEKGLDLRQHSVDCWLLSDPALLRRVLNNLVSNALRHTRQGAVLLACRRGATQARIEIWDTGPGIPPEFQEAIFDELVQLENPERDANKGLGLGLAIVRRTAHLLNHPIQLKSRVGKGSCFSITLPLTRAPLLPETDAGIAVAVTAPVFLLGKETPQQAELAALLDNWGYAPTVFSSADEVIAWVADHPAPALLIGETGGDLPALAALLDRIDAATGGQALPAILIHPGPCPAASTPENRQRLVLSRPFRPARLRALVTHLLADGNA
jgi:two-component system, sensor histidine kinase